MQHDGDGWARCDQGHQHWGRHGAAGLLLQAVDDEGVLRILLQHRAAWSHHGGTWGLPGGARDSHEDVVAAALREVAEETGLDPAAIRTRHALVDDHGGWSYTTVVADLPAPAVAVAGAESHQLGWIPHHRVTALPLHPGFAATWPQVAVAPVVLLVDAANVVGSRPDGWWRDRASAAARLLAALDPLRSTTIRLPGGSPRVVAAAAAVLEGAAVAAPDPGWVSVHRTPRGGSGDDVLVAVAAQLLAAGREVVAVTADRGLRSRWAALVDAGRGRAVVADPGTGARDTGRDPAGTGHREEGRDPTGAGPPGTGPGGRAALVAAGPGWLLDLLGRTAPAQPPPGSSRP